MRTFGILAVLVIFAAFALSARFCYTCNLNGACEGNGDMVVEDSSGVRSKDLSFIVDKKPVYSGFDQFAFTGSGDMELDLNANNEAFLDSVTAYLNRFPGSNIEIVGRFQKGEKGAGFLDNAGLVRADKIRAALIARKIGEDRINIDSEQLQAGAGLSAPLLFEGSLQTATAGTDPEDPTGAGTDPDAKDETSFEQAKFTFTNMTFSDVSFESGSAEFKPVEQFRNYADSVALFLKENPDKKIKIIGHTDSDGGDDMNMNLGRERAKSVRAYLSKEYKINQKKIEIDSKGESSPVATNETDDGKRRNRRVNIQII